MDERAPDMNARGTGKFLSIGATFHAPPKPAVSDARIFWSSECRRWSWHSSRALRISRLAITASVLLGASSALASQGPGAAGGTASPLTQLVMAILVYGASALVVGAGLIGALRGH